MSSLTIISGAPGTGKTTVAGVLARATPQGVHIPSDVFYGFPAHPIPPSRPEAREQNTAIITAMTRAAATFAAHGHDVFLDGIVGPWFVPLVVATLSAPSFPVHYAVLRAPLAVAIERVRRRADASDERMVEQMHGELADLGRYGHHAVETDGRAPEEIAAEIIRRRDAGELVLR